MVQRSIVTHNSTAPGEWQAMETTTTTRKVKRRRPDAMAAIKARMLRCSRAKADQGRFKRGYLPTATATGRGAVDVDSAAFLYLACLVCTAPPLPVGFVGVPRN